MPIIGNFAGVMKKGFIKYDEDICDEYGNDIIGYFEGSTPVVL